MNLIGIIPRKIPTKYRAEPTPEHLLTRKPRCILSRPKLLPTRVCRAPAESIRASITIASSRRRRLPWRRPQGGSWRFPKRSCRIRMAASRARSQEHRKQPYQGDADRSKNYRRTRPRDLGRRSGGRADHLESKFCQRREASSRCDGRGGRLSADASPTALHLFTGSPAAKDVASSSKIGNKIAQALGNGQPIVAFCANNDEGALVSGHEWTVAACDPKANRITLRNPWGNFKTAGTSKAGVAYDGNAEVTMTLQLFGQFYKEVTFGYLQSLIGRIFLPKRALTGPH